jgi:integrase
MKSKYAEQKLNNKVHISADGREFEIEGDSWRLNKNVVVAIKWSSKLDIEVVSSFRHVLARFAEEYAAETVKGLNDELRRYFNIYGDKTFKVDSLISFRSSLPRDKEFRIAKIRMLLRNWYEWGYPGITKDVIELLDGWRLKGTEKGKAIKSLDVKEGPLTEVEMNGLVDAMLQAYMSSQLSLEEYALSIVLVYTGRRPIQITSLKIKDLGIRKAENIYDYWINFPRAKQRFSKWRSEFNQYPVTEDVWNLLDAHAKKVITQVEAVVGFTIDEDLKGKLPLFPDYRVVKSSKSKQQLADILVTDEPHISRDYCNEVMTKLEEKLNVYSERTGERLNLATRRFRYTLGSNIAREGKGELIIAEALDHSDTQNVGVYVKNLPDVVERIDKAVAFQLAPLAQAFQGVLIASESDATRGEDPCSRIGNGNVNVGSCGSYSFCNAMAPVACYTCKHFQPWVDAPHEVILDQLLEKRDAVLRNTKDKKIASANDRLILAVSQVIQKCSTKKSESLLVEDQSG